MTDRNEIVSKVINLRELAESSNSLGEATNAMKAADRLMRGYRIEEAELAMAEATGKVKFEIVTEKRRPKVTVGRNRHKVQAIMWNLGYFCEVKPVICVRGSAMEVTGDKPDVDLFYWLLEHLRDAMDRSYANWKRKQQGVGRGAKAAFQLSFARTVRERLDDMTAERTAERASAESEAARLLNVDAGSVGVAVSNGNIGKIADNRALVIASIAQQKRTEVDAAFKAEYARQRLGTASGFGYANRGGSASEAGRAAGRSVGLARPVGAASAPRLSQ